MSLEAGLSGFADRIWYRGSRLGLPLVPLSWLYGGAVALHRMLYRRGILKTLEAGRPVIVIGNLTAGGAGKTPVTLWLADALKERGLRPGIASRGYGGNPGPAPVEVSPEDTATRVGDEPLMMARRLVCPVVVHPDRVAAARLLAHMGCNVILADDGLQHCRLSRSVELLVVDGRRGFGNRRLLPAGPLREPLARLGSVDRILIQGNGADSGTLSELLPSDVPRTRFRLRPEHCLSFGGTRAVPLGNWRGRRVHAVAGIGDPERFFRLLENCGIEVIRHAHPDHAPLGPDALHFGDGLDVFITEKDAARLDSAAASNLWYLPVELGLYDKDMRWVDELAEALRAQDTA